ncbi:hypothetical protein G3580_17560 [Nitrogeniibacter mangrovi]|uniref:Chemotaxis protein CheZ n=1 Tax=Nitrogeniibacter mangrovi TaxID=2016596 RepID=A0A6C1B6B0_9RHOO|nr:hypothetical protein [Nitrogeniibacter mangrovi]QID19266.1 hypothetical protein G3580_17560 [Nitrogeniibacter mangrovi]
MSDQEREARRGTRAHNPDLDWSQVRETVLMLELAAGQIEAAMRDGDNSVETLTDAFTSLAGYVRGMSSELEALPDEGEIARIKGDLTAQTTQLSAMVQQSIIAFQFYDKLAQRLAHVCHSLSALSGLVVDQSRLYNPFEWVALQEKIRARYSTREEAEMFEAVMNGMPVKEALAQYVAGQHDKGDEDIELF